MKTLAILFTLFYFLNALAVAPYGIKGQNQSVTYPNVYQYPNYSVTGLGGINALIETGNKNILENPSFEAPFFGSAPPSWTSLGMTFNTSALPLSGQKAVRVSMSSSVMAFAQDSGVSQAAFAGGIQCLAMVYVKTTVSGIFVSSRQNSVTSTTNRVAVNNDGKYGLYKVPFICGSGSNGISIHSNGVAVTGDVDIDDSFVGAVDLKVDSSITKIQTSRADITAVLNAPTTLNGTAVISGNTSDLFSYNSTTGIYTVLKDSYYDLSGSATVNNTGALMVYIVINGAIAVSKDMSATGAGVGWAAAASWTGKLNAGEYFQITLNNGQSQSHSVAVKATEHIGISTYSSTNADTDWAACSFSTLAWQGLGTVTNTLMCKRQGSDLLMMGAFTSGTATTSLMQIPLPTWNNSSLTIKALSYSGANTVGTGYLGTPFSNTYKEGNIIAGSGLNYLSIGGIFDTSTQNPLAPMAGNAFIGNSTVLTLFARIPINGWEQSNIIIGQFNGLQSCTDTLACTDTFSARISSTGVVTSENANWINGNCTLSATSSYTCPLATSLTVPMACTVTQEENTGGVILFNNMVFPQVSNVLVVLYTASSRAPYNFNLICQKQGADYIGKTAMAVASDQNVRSIGSTNVDIQSVYFGSGAPCTTGTCTINNQVGSKITSVTWAAAGLYNINGIDGTKYNCSGAAFDSLAAGSTIALEHDRPSSTASLVRINSIIATVGRNIGWASVTCIGIP